MFCKSNPFCNMCSSSKVARLLDFVQIIISQSVPNCFNPCLQIEHTTLLYKLQVISNFPSKVWRYILRLEAVKPYFGPRLLFGSLYLIALAIILAEEKRKFWILFYVLSSFINFLINFDILGVQWDPHLTFLNKKLNLIEKYHK